MFHTWIWWRRAVECGWSGPWHELMPPGAASNVQPLGGPHYRPGAAECGHHNPVNWSRRPKVRDEEDTCFSWDNQNGVYGAQNAGPRMKLELHVRVYLLVQGLQALNVTIGSCSTHERGKQRLTYLIHLLLVKGRVTLVLIILTSAVILV